MLRVHNTYLLSRYESVICYNTSHEHVSAGRSDSPLADQSLFNSVHPAPLPKYREPVLGISHFEHLDALCRVQHHLQERLNITGLTREIADQMACTP